MKKLLLALLIYLFTFQFINAQFNYPPTKKVEQTDNYFGTIVEDPYRWLENDKSDETKAWVDAQNKVTFDYLEKIPFRDKIKERLTKIWNYPKYSTPFKEGDKYYFYKNDGLQNQSVLYAQDELNSEPRVFLDPNKFSEDGTVALSQLSFSNDAKYVVYGTASGGSDWNELFIMESATQKKLSDHIKWVKFSGTSWFKDGFFYSRYDEPAKGEELTKKNEYHKVYYHKVGTDQSSDILVYENKDRAKRNFYASVTEDERFLILYMSEGASGNNAFMVKDLAKEKSEFIPVVTDFIYRYSVIDNIGDKLLILTNHKSPRKKIILADPNNFSEENWIEIIPEQKEVLQWGTIIGGKLIVSYLKDASSRAYAYSLDGKFEYEIELPTLGTLGWFSGKKKDTTAFYTFTSFTFPTAIYHFDVNSRKSTMFRASEIDFKFDNYETKQVFYPSKDGTRIPMFIVHKKGLKLDGSNPTYLYAYGGFNASMLPSFSVSRLIFLENGGVYAMANLRGGGEYGEEWHEAGMLLNKQNVFDDFIAAAEYLIREKYTSAKKLAIAGGSNGGLLIGAVMNQRPELFKVALPAVGVMDMLRYHKFTIGWAWAAEYGSSDDSTHFENLYSYSPLHNIREDLKYPATFVTTADHDDRVVPAHSFKYVSTLQEKYKGENPILIRIETRAGHGAGKPTTKQIEEQTDIWSFVFYNLNVEPLLK
jgi:prolyl oligopeptidase